MPCCFCGEQGTTSLCWAVVVLSCSLRLLLPPYITVSVSSLIFLLLPRVIGSSIIPIVINVFGYRSFLLPLSLLPLLFLVSQISDVINVLLISVATAVAAAGVRVWSGDTCAQLRVRLVRSDLCPQV